MFCAFFALSAFFALFLDAKIADWKRPDLYFVGKRNEIWHLNAICVRF